MHLKADVKHWVWICLMRKLSPSNQKRLIDYFGSPRILWDLNLREIMDIPFIKPVIIDQLLDPSIREEAEKIVERMIQNNIRLLTIYDDGYPMYLKEIPDAPVVLFVKGSLIPEEIIIGVVGSRHATRYGKDLARKIGFELAMNGITVISGMARGIDTYSHMGAIEAGGRTIAVLGCGLDIVYPPENSRIMQEIERSGALISEYPPGEEPKSYNFPPRNRIISGASVGVIVVEAGEKSGSLITAHYALEQGREVFAVPGSVFSSNSVGTNKLIKDGAKMVTSMEDIFEELQIYFNTENKRERQKDAGILVNSLRGEEKLIGKALLDGEMHIDKLQQETGLDTGRLNSLLVVMEMKGLVEQLPGKIYRLNCNLKKF